MKTYYSTFITGFSEVIEHELKKQVRDVQIVSLTDGLVIYKTNKNLDAIKQLRFFNNSFIFLKRFPNLGENPVNKMLKQTLNDKQVISVLRSSLPHKKIAFRVMATEENQFVAMDKNLKEKFEKFVMQLRHFILNRSYPDVELLFTVRREGHGLLGLRFTRHTSYEKTLEKGELYPELAHILCFISEPSANDVFIDPFCGSGAIPIERVKSFLYNTIYAYDIEKKSVQRTQRKANKRRNKLVISQADALHLTRLGDNSVDKIVTDPPWGLHSGKELNLEQFYTDMLDEFVRIIKPDGIMVILVAKKELFEAVLNKFTGKLELAKKYTTLVSGQKAGVYKLRSI